MEDHQQTVEGLRVMLLVRVGKCTIGGSVSDEISQVAKDGKW